MKKDKDMVFFGNLLTKNGIHPLEITEMKFFESWFECIIPIGADHSVTVLMTDEAYHELNVRVLQSKLSD
jgi:hypothetical protein